MNANHSIQQSINHKSIYPYLIQFLVILPLILLNFNAYASPAPTAPCATSTFLGLSIPTF